MSVAVPVTGSTPLRVIVCGPVTDAIPLPSLPSTSFRSPLSVVVTMTESLYQGPKSGARAAARLGSFGLLWSTLTSAEAAE